MPQLRPNPRLPAIIRHLCSAAGLLMFTCTASAAPELNVEPSARHWFAPSSVRVSGAAPGARVTLEATFKDLKGVQWTSRGQYYADANGHVDVARMASAVGTYTGTYKRGLIWSALPATAETLNTCSATDCLPTSAPPMPALDTLGPTRIVYRAKISGTEILTAKQSVGTPAGTVVRQKVSQGALRGVLYAPTPKQNKPKENTAIPSIILVSGSGGGVSDWTAALFAAQGFNVFALAYFNYDGRPDRLAEIPLEYFRGGIDWLRAYSGQERVGLLGGSRGGEAVLLIAATYPEHVAAVVSLAPSNVAWPGCCDAKAAAQASWTINGKPVPSAAYGFADGEGFDTRETDGTWRTFFLPGMLEPGDAAIQVEKIDAPIMLISGDADEIWPSSIAAQAIIKRLDRYAFPHATEWLDFSGAGHMLSSPRPVRSGFTQFMHPLSKQLILPGGAPEIDAVAIETAFHRQVAFLHRHLKATQ
ncbi:MAG: alpha/beta fold hydrolase [Pseudomonadota bacterium]